MDDGRLGHVLGQRSHVTPVRTASIAVIAPNRARPAVASARGLSIRIERNEAARRRKP